MLARIFCPTATFFRLLRMSVCTYLCLYVCTCVHIYIVHIWWFVRDLWSISRRSEWTFIQGSWSISEWSALKKFTHNHNGLCIIMWCTVYYCSVKNSCFNGRISCTILPPLLYTIYLIIFRTYQHILRMRYVCKT